MDLLKANFPPKKTVEPEEKKDEYEKKALENIGGSMVFVEKKKLTWDSKKS